MSQKVVDCFNLGSIRNDELLGIILTQFMNGVFRFVYTWLKNGMDWVLNKHPGFYSAYLWSFTNIYTMENTLLMAYGMKKLLANRLALRLFSYI